MTVWVSIREVAERVGFSYSTASQRGAVNRFLWPWCERNDIEIRKESGRWCVSGDRLDAVLDDVRDRLAKAKEMTS